MPTGMAPTPARLAPPGGEPVPREGGDHLASWPAATPMERVATEPPRIDMGAQKRQHPSRSPSDSGRLRERHDGGVSIAVCRFPAGVTFAGRDSRIRDGRGSARRAERLASPGQPGPRSGGCPKQL